MTKALISIDYTEDFVADSGKLTAGAPAQAISDAISKVTRLAFERGDYIFFTIDAHEENDCFHPESKLFPPHNLIGTSAVSYTHLLASSISRTAIFFPVLEDLAVKKVVAIPVIMLAPLGLVRT